MPASDSRKKNVKRYHDMQIQTSGLRGLIVYMHKKIVTLIKKGIEERSRRDIERAQNLIYQLELALDKNEETSNILAELYAYCYYLLETADTHNIMAARKIMGTLGDTFDTLAKQKK